MFTPSRAIAALFLYITLCAAATIPDATTTVPDSPSLPLPTCPDNGIPQCCQVLHDKDSEGAKIVATVTKVDVAGSDGKLGILCKTADPAGQGTECPNPLVCCSRILGPGSLAGIIAVGCLAPLT